MSIDAAAHVEAAEASPARARAPMLLPVLVLVVSVAASFWLYVVVRNAEEGLARLRFERQASDVRYAIEARVNSYAEIMYGLRAVLASRSEVSRDQFHRYVAALDLPRRYPGYGVVNYAVRVAREDRDAFVRAVRSDTSLDPAGYPAFEIRPPGDRDEYFVIKYVEPMQGFEFAFGLDLAANPAIEGAGSRALTALQYAARDSGELTASGRPIRIKRAGRDQTGLAVRLAVYRSGMPVRTLEDRRAAYVGSVGVGFYVDELIKGALDPEVARYMYLSITDVGAAEAALEVEPGARRLLYENSQLAPAADRPGRDGEADDHFRSTLPLAFGGRLWHIHLAARKDAIIDRIGTLLPRLMLLGGIVSSLLLSGVFYSLATSRGRAERIAREITRDLRESERELRNSAEQMQALSRRLVDVQESERRQLSRELHDRVGQNLTALSISLDILTTQVHEDRDGAIRKRLGDAATLLESTTASIENVMAELRPPMLDDYGLAAALQWYAGDFRGRTGIEVDVHGAQGAGRLAQPSEIALFRIAQEAMNNVVKHAQAGRICIELARTEEYFTMTVSDDGVGLPAASARSGRRRTGLGMVTMRERTQAIGGEFEIGPAPGQGTRVAVRVAC